MTHEASTTPEAKIAYLAEKIMGWSHWDHTSYDPCWYEAIGGGDGKYHLKSAWNPLTDWNHWRQVEEKVMGNEDLEFRYTEELISRTPARAATLSFTSAWMADLPTRVDALISAHQSLHDA